MKNLFLLFSLLLILNIRVNAQTTVQTQEIQKELLENNAGITSRMVVSFSAPKEDTKGSRYLFGKFVKGVIINNKNEKLDNGYLFNYDKIVQQFIITQDEKVYFAVEEQNVKLYSLNINGSENIFMKLGGVDDVGYVQLIEGKQGQYILCKSVKTKLKKADYNSNGLIESGHNYDEYIDEYGYYIVLPDGKTVNSISFKKNVIKQCLSKEGVKVDAYFIANKNSTINEDFLKGLIKSLNG